MVNVHLYLDTRRENKRGLYPLKLSFSKNGTNAMISIGIELGKDQWNGHQIVNHPKRALLNAIVNTKLSSFQQAILELTHNGSLTHKTAKETLDFIMEYTDPFLAEEKKRKEAQDDLLIHSFSKYFKNHIEQQYNSGTKSLYEGTLKKISLFCIAEGIDLSTLTFDQITVPLLKGFENYCLQTQTQNTASRHLRDIRAVFNSAIDDGLTTNYPFRKLKIKKCESRDKSFTAEELRRLFEASTYPGNEEEAVDMFKLSFFLIGINPVDLYNAPKPLRGRLVFDRKKTKKMYSIKIETEAACIIDKYSGTSKMLYISEKYQNYKTYFNRMSKALRKVGKIQHAGKKSTGEPVLKNVCWGSARTSWATIAQQDLDIPREVISASLGHHVVNVTDTYLRTKWEKKIDEANRKVIDWVLYAKK